MTTILIADDSPVERKLAAGLLTANLECSLLSATNGVEALAELDRRPAAVDLVLSDLRMPVMDGMELLAAVRNRFPAIPVVIMTSKGSEEIAVQALQQGAAGYVPKRRLRQLLLQIVNSVLSANRHDRDHARVTDRLVSKEFTLKLGNDRAELPAVISYLQQVAAEFGICDDRNHARLGGRRINKKLNAVIHGNLEVNSELRQQEDDAFDRLIRQRQETDPYASRSVHVTCRLTDRDVLFRIRDEGPGFDVAAIPDPTDPANLNKPCGRGLLLMRSFMDSVTYNQTGNEVTMRLSAAEADAIETAGSLAADNRLLPV